jgi:hypothetical protein
MKEENLVTRSIAGETIIVPIKNNVGDLDSIYTLNELGTMIWELIDSRNSVSQIIEAVRNAYEVAPEIAEKDTMDFINLLEEGGLISPIRDK